MSDFNVQIKVRSGRIIRAMRARGFATVADLCRAMGQGDQGKQATVGELVNLKASPLRSDGEWRKVALDVASALCVPEEELWPHHMAKQMLRRNIADFDTNREQLGELLAAPANVDRGALESLVQQCSPREQKVLEMRFGLLGEGEATLDEVGGALGVSRGRAGQIEQKALRKMKARARRLGLEQCGDVLGNVT